MWQLKIWGHEVHRECSGKVVNWTFILNRGARKLTTEPGFEENFLERRDKEYERWANFPRTVWEMPDTVEWPGFQHLLLHICLQVHIYANSQRWVQESEEFRIDLWESLCHQCYIDTALTRVCKCCALTNPSQFLQFSWSEVDLLPFKIISYLAW